MKSLFLVLLFPASVSFAQSHKILMSVETSAHHKDGTKEIDGFKFERIDRDSLFEKAGAQVNDILKAVDHEAINSTQKALAMETTLEKPGRHEMVVERDGKLKTLSVSVK